MKTLAIRQPWATYIAEGSKTIEVRTWQTDYRGPLLVVASGRPYPHADEEGVIHRLPTQVRLCVVELVEVRAMRLEDEEAALTPWSPGLFAWVLQNPRHVEPLQQLGRLWLHETDDASIRYIGGDAHFMDCLKVAA